MRMPLLQMVDSTQFAALREHFLRTGFSEEALRQRLDVQPGKELDLAALSGRPPLSPKVGDALDAIIYLFVLGESLPAEDAESSFPPSIWNALCQSHLIVPDPADGNRRIASVALYPIRDLFIVSDRWNNPDHSPRQMFPDIVYPCLTKSARQFIDYTSYEPCEDFLELCAGTAPAALLASRSAKNIWATDIAQRSIAFAKFNAALNGIDNVNFALGDLYQPLEGRTFDRIAAHPPYVPVLKPAEIFYGGGEVGEEITQRIIEGLPARLKPGGRFYCRTMGTERPGQQFENRIRGWLGANQAEFDVALFVVQTFEPRQFALEETLAKNGSREQYAQWEKLFTKNDVRGLVIGIVIVQRTTEQRPAFTIRRTIRTGTPLAALEWVLRWETEMQMEGATRMLLGTKPVATPGIEIIVRHALRNGEICQESFTLSIEKPFAMDCKVQPWMAALLPRCDGKTTVAELFETAKQSEWIVPDTPPEEFCRLLATLISGGFLQTEAFRLPAAAG
jgi:methylase of polypeptide subunit release factors